MVKKKFMLYGIGNEGKFNHYTFEKTEKAKNVLRQIFDNALGVNWSNAKEVENEDGSYEMVKIDITKNIDFHEVLRVKNNPVVGSPRVDVFYGDKRMFITIHCSLEKRKEIHEVIKKEFVMPDPSKETFGRVKISKGVNNEKEIEKKE